MKKKLTKNKIYKILATLMLLIFLHYVGFLRPVENFFNKLLNPFASKIYEVGHKIKNIYAREGSEAELRTSLDVCEKEKNEFISLKARAEELEKENEKLKNFLDFKEKNQLKTVLAQVLYQENFNYSENTPETLVIGAGTLDGVEPGLVVVDGAGAVIGKIRQVKEKTSQITLLVSQSCKMAVSVQNQDRTQGVAEGELGLTVKINFIPQTEEISVGDNIVTSGLEKNIPSGLVLGRVERVDKDSNEIWQTAVVEPLTDLDDLTVVSVVLGMEE